MRRIEIIGAGPAGSAAALAAMAEGCRVRVFEKSVFPRHKVCGEFLSPEVPEVLETLGAWTAIAGAGPARIGRVRIRIGRREKCWNLPENGFGLSRHLLDRVLLDLAIERGAELVRASRQAGSGPAVIAHGRKESAKRGRRLFGFKAHFSGPGDDAVELHFQSGCYVGVSSVEAGKTNICGLAPEPLLSSCGFDPDELLRRLPPVRERTAPLRRTMPWLTTGPLVFRHSLHSSPENGIYKAGDALGFIDPFTGSGILSALITGRMAGIAAARAHPPQEHLRACRKALSFQYGIAGLLRAAISAGWAEMLAPFIPGALLFQLTRPRLVA